MAYGIAVFGEDHCDEDNCEIRDIDATEPIWKRYVDVGLKYCWWGFLNQTYFAIDSEDVPTHPCGDFTEEGFDERDPF